MYLVRASTTCTNGKQGNFIGPTVLSGVKEDMACYTEEIFGPILCCMHVGTLDEAIALVNRNRCDVSYVVSNIGLVLHRRARVSGFERERRTKGTGQRRGRIDGPGRGRSRDTTILCN